MYGIRSTIMPPREVDNLVGLLHDTVGDNLRNVVHYHENGLYIRDDIKSKYSEQEMGEVVQYLGFEAFGNLSKRGFMSTTTSTVQFAVSMRPLR